MTAPKAKRGRGPRQDGAEKSPANAEALLARLDQVVRELEAGELPLEQALAHFEEGIRLVRDGEALLSSVEQRIELLLSSDRGDDRRVPFAEARDYSDDEPAGDEPEDHEDHEDHEDPDEDEDGAQ